MNEWKRGDRLVEEVNLAARNAHFHHGGAVRYTKENKPRKARHDLNEEKKCLQRCIKKAQARINQIEQDLGPRIITGIDFGGKTDKVSMVELRVGNDGKTRLYDSWTLPEKRPLRYTRTKYDKKKIGKVQKS